MWRDHVKWRGRIAPKLGPAILAAACGGRVLPTDSTPSGAVNDGSAAHAGAPDAVTPDSAGARTPVEGGIDGGSDATISATDADYAGGDGGSPDATNPEAGDEGGACSANLTRCSGNDVQTCASNGQWGSALACGAQTPLCLNGACLAPSLDGGSVTPPSCLPGGVGMSNCGPGDGGIESCCTSLEVEGGVFYRTYDPLDTDGGIILAADGGPAGEADLASVSTFRLDKYDVTVGRFRQFVLAWSGGWLPAAGSGKHVHLNGGSGLMNVGGDAGPAYELGWLSSDDGNVAPTNTNLGCGGSTNNTWRTDSPGQGDNLPVTCTNWFEAYSFCIWDGGFLPSEAEWEYAAAGGTEQREYPWGSTDPGTGSQYAIYACNFPRGSGGCAPYFPTFLNLAPVGTPTLGAGRWGQLDMAGEIDEWAADWYAGYANPCKDCANLTTSGVRVTHAGDYASAAQALPPPARANDAPADRNYFVGFRCARAP